MIYGIPMDTHKSKAKNCLPAIGKGNAEPDQIGVKPNVVQFRKLGTSEKSETSKNTVAVSNELEARLRLPKNFRKRNE